MKLWPFKKTSQSSNTAGKGATSSREQIIAQAKANAAAARAEIGDETLDKIKAALLKKQSSAIEQAKNTIRGQDPAKIRENMAMWLDKTS